MRAELLEEVKTGVDVLAVGVAAGTVLKLLPPLAALLTIIWLGTRLWEYVRWIRRGRKPEEKP